MSLFQHTTYAPDQAFANLFRLIDGFDSYSREVNGGANGKAVRNGTAISAHTFNPRFDVRETEGSYELHGELPGVERKDIGIEFSDSQTLVVSGRIERTYEEQPPANTSDVNNSANTPAAGGSASPSLKATVADEETESLHEDAVVVDAKKAEVAPTNKGSQEVSSTTKASRYWYRERSVGQFRRVFEFPVAINEDAVSASLSNGILNITIPKAAKRQTKRIAVL